MRVLVTRPQPDAEATAQRLEAAGYEPIVDPMLIVGPLVDARLPPGAFDGVVLTSVNGARALATRPELGALRAAPLYTVGKRTAAAAPPGFARLSVADGDGAALAVLLRREVPAGARLLHVAGEDRAIDLAAELAGDGIAVELFIIYRAMPAAGLAEATRDALAGGQIDAALHFSPRTAATLAGHALRDGLQPEFARIRHLCFSHLVAAPLRAAGAAAHVAAAPTEDALFALLET